jgi:hypothetical protein
MLDLIKTMTTIDVVIPNGFMNTGITTNNYFIADTNDSNNWDTIKFPLPKGIWKIDKINGKIVTLCQYIYI